MTSLCSRSTFDSVAAENVFLQILHLLSYSFFFLLRFTLSVFCYCVCVVSVCGSVVICIDSARFRGEGGGWVLGDNDSSDDSGRREECNGCFTILSPRAAPSSSSCSPLPLPVWISHSFFFFLIRLIVVPFVSPGRAYQEHRNTRGEISDLNLDRETGT